MFIDTHCHLSIKDYDDIDKIIKDNRNNGVKKIIISVCEYSDFDEGLDLICKYEDVYMTIGFHPSEAKDVDDDKLSILENIISSVTKVVGVGEIGLDYHYDNTYKEKQRDLFEKQLILAEKYNLPVVIHTRDATEDTINILKKHNSSGIIHCFSGSYETARIYLNLGYKLGIGGIVTFKNSKLPEVLRKISIDDIVLETDSPYLCPEPFRGKQNSSKYIPIIAIKIAEIYNVDVDLVEKRTTSNACKVFDL